MEGHTKCDSPGMVKSAITGCSWFGWELNKQDFRWLDLILPLLISSIKFTEMSERGGDHLKIEEMMFLSLSMQFLNSNSMQS